VRLALCLAAVFAASASADVRTSRQDAALLKQKVATISAHADRASRQPRRTTVTESEVNSYLIYEAGQQLPTGVVEPSISILGGGRVAARAVVDLDAVRREKNPTSLLDPMNYLMGKVPVSATGLLKTSNGVARVEFESAAISRLPIPKFLLQEIISYYSRTTENPAGINLDDPFALPARIREIQVERGHAIIVQ
jgi:hypothetical protein